MPRSTRSKDLKAYGENLEFKVRLNLGLNWIKLSF